LAIAGLGIFAYPGFERWGRYSSAESRATTGDGVGQTIE
jgi:hypothetical protein